MSTLVTLSAWFLLGGVLVGFWRWLAAPRRQAALANWHGVQIALAWCAGVLYLPVALWTLASGIFGGSRLAATIGGILYALTLLVWGAVVVLTWQWATARARQRAGR